MMKRFLLLALLLLAAAAFSSEVIQERTPGGRTFSTVPGDPFGFRVRKLENGLTLWLARNPEKPVIATLIAVRAGSVQDPASSTGLAHYFEHLMFKGSKKIASLDWSKEKPLLDRITALYEQYRAEKDPAKRKAIYAEIDKVSGEAAKYANDEYWTLVRNLGATGTNAFTSDELTAYVNTIPANMLDRFLTLEAERFSNIALRRFHTELETVYEEFNRTQDNESRQVYYALMQKLYPDSPFGRPVIGLPEHLKNPSVKDVAAFFEQYYVPGNMAVILCGDLDYDKASEAVEKTFGRLPAKKNTRSEPAPERTLPGKDIITVTGPKSETVSIMYRFPRDRKTDYLFGLAASVLENGKCGLIDIDLNQAQKVLYAGSSGWNNSQDNLLYLTAAPVPGQTLDQLRDLLLAEVAKLQNGEFDGKLLAASVNNDRIDLIHHAENASSAANLALNLFGDQQTMADILDDLDRSGKATKEMVAAYAKEKLRNCAVVYKRTGKPEDRVHAEKPPITPVAIPAQPSAFAKEVQKVAAGPEPEITIPDFDKEIVKLPAGNGFDLYATKNKDNERFRLRFVFPEGTYHDPMLALAMGYAEMADTEKRPQSEFNKELYTLALDLSFSCGKLESSITISGLQRNLPQAMELLAERIRQMKADPAIWEKSVKRIEQDRENTRKDPGAKMNAAVNFALYGADNPVRNELPMDAIRKITAQELTAYIQRLPDMPHDIVYYGPGDPKEVAELVAKDFSKAAKADVSAFKPLKAFKIKPAEQNIVYTVQIPGKTQITAYLIRTDEIAIPGDTVRERLLSRYAGQLAFSELREKQSLGYMTGSFYAVPGILPDNYSYFAVVLGTQPDKLETGLNAMLKFADAMPQEQDLFAASKKNALSTLRAARTKTEFLYDAKKAYLRLKQPFDLRKRDYRVIEAMTPEAFFADAAKHMKNGKNVFILSGDLSKIPPELLKKYGKVVELTPDELFMK